MTRCNPRIINPSIHLQLQRTGDEQGCPPDQYRPARCGNPNMEFVKPAPSAIREGYGPIPGSEILQTGDDNGGTPGRYRPARCGNPTPVADWPGFVKPPAPGEYTIPSSEQNAFLISTTPIFRGRNRLSPRTAPPRTVWKFQLQVHHCWLWFVKPAVSTHWGQEGSASSFPMI